MAYYPYFCILPSDLTPLALTEMSRDSLNIKNWGLLTISSSVVVILYTVLAEVNAYFPGA